MMNNPTYTASLTNDRFYIILQAFVVMTAIGSMFSSLAFAEETSLTEDDKLKLTLGAFFVQHSNATIRVDQVLLGAINIGTSIDWDRDLKGDTRMTVPRMDGYYRFTPKHRVDFGWYDIARKGEVVLANDISFGDITLNAGDGIVSHFDTETIKASYTYSFYRAPEIEVALSAGLHVSRLAIEIKTTSGGKAESSSVTAPLPVMGFRLNYNLSKKWQVATKYEMFFLDDVDKYSGSLTDFVLTVEHQTFKHVKFGAGFNRLETNLAVKTSNNSAESHGVLDGFLFYTALNY